MVKGQNVRALDVWVIGPAMIAGGSIVYKHAHESRDRRALGAFLIFAGVGTIIYNGHNWLKGEAAADAAAASEQPAPPAAAPQSAAMTPRA